MGIGDRLPPQCFGIAQRADFGEVRYANCWEDAAVLVRALAPLAGARCLSIGSAGDNAFSLLARGAQVVVADISPAQLALVELKGAAFAALDHPALLGFLGVLDRRAEDRLATYGLLRSSLGESARRFWDRRTAAISDGVLHQGRLERYFRFFRTLALPLVHSRATVRALLEPRSRGVPSIPRPSPRVHRPRSRGPGAPRGAWKAGRSSSSIRARLGSAGRTSWWRGPPTPAGCSS